MNYKLDGSVCEKAPRHFTIFNNVALGKMLTRENTKTYVYKTLYENF